MCTQDPPRASLHDLVPLNFPYKLIGQIYPRPSSVSWSLTCWPNPHWVVTGSSSLVECSHAWLLWLAPLGTNFLYVHIQIHLGAWGESWGPPPQCHQGPLFELRADPASGEKDTALIPPHLEASNEGFFSICVCFLASLQHQAFFIKLFQPLAFATPFSPPCTTSYLWIALLPVISSIHIHTTRKALLFSILIISELVFEIQPLLSNPLYNFQKQSFKHANSQCPILPPAGQIPDLWLEARNCPRSGPTSLRLSESRVLPCTQGQTWDRHSLFLYQSMLFPFLYLRLCVALSPNSLFCLD